MQLTNGLLPTEVVWFLFYGSLTVLRHFHPWVLFTTDRIFNYFGFMGLYLVSFEGARLVVSLYSPTMSLVGACVFGSGNFSV